MFQKNKIVTAIILLAITGNSYAQLSKQDSLHSLQDERVLTVYQRSGNPATLVQAIYPQYGFAAFNAQHTTGNYKRPMEPESATAIGAETGGYRTLKGWTYNGYFSYKKMYENEVPWSGVYDPYEGNPFLWADSSTGAWERDAVKANIALATPALAKKFVVGLAIDYTISTGARKRDPKPFFRYRDIALRPGITYQISAKEEVGITGTAGFAKEENEIGFLTNSNNVLLYRLRGFGTFTKTPFVSGERKRTEMRWMGAAHYTKRWKAYGLLLAAYASQRDDEVIEGVAALVTTGYFTGIQYGGEAVLYKGNSDKGTSFSVKGSGVDGYADDVIFRAESASYSKQEAQATYSYWKMNTAKKTRWQFTLQPRLQYLTYVDGGTRTQWDASIVSVVAGLQYRKQLNRQTHLYIHPAIGYTSPVDDFFTNTTANIVTRKLIYPDYAYFAASYTMANLSAGVEFGAAESTLLHSIQFSTRNQFITSDNGFGNRNHFQLIYSILF